jgi:hypothetical protein
MVVWKSSASRLYASAGMCGNRVMCREISPQIAMMSIKKAIGLRVERSSPVEAGMWLRKDWK